MLEETINYNMKVTSTGIWAQLVRSEFVAKNFHEVTSRHMDNERYLVEDVAEIAMNYRLKGILLCEVEKIDKSKAENFYRDVMDSRGKGLAGFRIIGCDPSQRTGTFRADFRNVPCP
jgi:hypothetical protein